MWKKLSDYPAQWKIRPENYLKKDFIHKINKHGIVGSEGSFTYKGAKYRSHASPESFMLKTSESDPFDLCYITRQKGTFQFLQYSIRLLNREIDSTMEYQTSVNTRLHMLKPNIKQQILKATL